MAAKLIGLAFTAAFLLFGFVRPASASDYAITDVTIIDVETGNQRAGQTVLVRGAKIRAIGPSATVRVSGKTIVVRAAGKYLIPGLWDMHVHSHRERRWTYHYPLFRAFGITGIREAGSHLGSSLAAMARVKDDPLAPQVIWGSPIIDGAPPFNDFGLSAEDEPSARELVRQAKRLGFDFVKVYDRLSPDAYKGLAQEAQRLGMRLEGHVPLALSPAQAVQSGQSLIDHLTLVMESCIPGALEATNAAQKLAPGETDSLDLLMDSRLAASLGGYDEKACSTLFRQFADHNVWQVPTLIEMKGYFHADDPAFIADPRIDLTTPKLHRQWLEWGSTAKPDKLANGRAVLLAQMRMIRQMQDHNVGLLAGTDASSEPWVFAGASLHDELELFVAAGLTPLEALRTATLNPALYRGRTVRSPLIAPGETADLVLLDKDPLRDIANTRSVSAVFARGQYHDRLALDALVETARTKAAQ